MTDSNASPARRMLVACCVRVAFAGAILIAACPAYGQSGGSGASGRSSAPPRVAPPRVDSGGSDRKGSDKKGSDHKGSEHKSSTGPGSAMKSEPMLAMKGFCPVCVVDMKQWNKGDPEINSVIDGKAYYFPSQEIRAKFNANPTKYVPALGGDDVVEYVRTGRRTPGSLAFGAVHDGRPFFFSSDANKRQFMASAAMFASADLAVGGECVVCRVDMRQKMPGNPATTVVEDGLRYQFIGVEQQKRFLSAPTSYVNAARAAGPMVSDSSGGSDKRGSSGTRRHGSASQPSSTLTGSGSGGR